MKALITAMLIAMTVGCMTNVNKESIDKAVELCSTNNGLNNIDSYNYGIVTCNNGAKFATDLWVR